MARGRARVGTTVRPQNPAIYRDCWVFSIDFGRGDRRSRPVQGKCLARHRRANGWVRMTTSPDIGLGRSRSNCDPSRVRFQLGRFWRPERHGAFPLQGACCFIFASSYRASACWYFCWYRQQSKTKTATNSNGYGTRRLQGAPDLKDQQ